MEAQNDNVTYTHRIDTLGHSPGLNWGITMKAFIFVAVLLIAIIFVVTACNGEEKSSSISGHIYEADGSTPISGANVYVDGEHGSTGFKQGVSGTDGRYIISGLNPGESIVAADAEGYVIQYYQNVYDSKMATWVITKSNRYTSNIDFSLEKGGSICGNVYESDGSIPNYIVYVWYKQLSGVPTPILGGCEPTYPIPDVRMIADGTYRITGLQEGKYLLSALPSGNVPQYHEGAVWSPLAIEVSVVMAKTTSGIDLMVDSAVLE